jgi:tetratricopeptide (TPR) repeat protein
MAGAVAALAMWPIVGTHGTVATTFTPAPLVRDYEMRDRFIEFYEREVRSHQRDQIEIRMLAAQYMQRFREQYDAGDIARAKREAEISIALQPQGNTSAQMTLASALLSVHDFRGALAHERAASSGQPFDPNPIAQTASIQMEMGEYGAARTTLGRVRRSTAENPAIDAVRARYEELHGRLDVARTLIGAATRIVDANVGTPAYDRSWYHLRAAQLAFEAGDFDASQREFDSSLADFPNNATALLSEARLYRAQLKWRQALAAASKSADLYPLPAALGYKADAQRALGDANGANESEALIAAEERLFNANGVNDRLLAAYYAQRRIHLDRALAAARADRRKRGDEIYADDTLGWVLAMMGRWSEARIYAERAVRFHAEDPQLQYHAAIVALHTGHRDEARALLRAALSRNVMFDPFDAPDARVTLSKL